MRIARRYSPLLLTLLLTLLTVPARAAEGFSDVPESHWAYASIQRTVELGLINGVGGGRFGRGQDVNRAEYSLMLCRLMGWEMKNPRIGSFDDNRDPSQWYYSAIETAYEHGVLLKLGASCGVKDPLQREEMAAMTVRALGYASLSGMVQDDCPFTDVSTNQGYIALAYHMGLMDGVKTGVFSPKTVSTREQAATVLLRAYDRLHAPVSQLNSVPAGVSAVRVRPLSGSQTPVPMCPRAPLESVYDAAVQAGPGGAVVLRTVPFSVTVKDETVQENGELSGGELTALLADKQVQKQRSSRYRSSYLVKTEGKTSTVVWYESAQDIAEKVQLCRMMGIEAVYLEE